MRYALDAQRMRAVESAAVASGETTIAQLMDRAGHALADEAERRVPAGPVVVVCGPGNNGGDGWVAARVLAGRGRDVSVVAMRPPGAPGEAGQAALEAVEAAITWVDGLKDDSAAEHLTDAALIIDALFGFGLRDVVRSPYAAWIERINAADAVVISADVPSGIDTDTGETLGCAVAADVTVTFSAPKPGLLLGEGALRAGDVVVADIGIGDHVARAGRALELPGARDVRGLIAWPAHDDHKGSRGRVVIVAGSESYPGAAVLAAGGALRMGAGYVYVVAPGRAADAVLGAWPSAITRVVSAVDDGTPRSIDDVLAAVTGADAVVAGPGITRSPGASAVVRALLREYPGPLVLDADALNVLVGDVPLLQMRAAPTVITPHLAEAARLLDTALDEVQRDRVSAADRLSGPSLVCVLKGAGTVIAGCGRTALVTTGGPELARAGTGDVLAGMLGTLLAQGLDAYEGAVAATYLHGRAGALGATRLTATAHVASDLFTFIPDAIRELGGG